MPDPDAILAYKVGCGPSNREAYKNAILDGRILPLRKEVKRDMRGLPVQIVGDGFSLLTAICGNIDLFSSDAERAREGEQK